MAVLGLLQLFLVSGGVLFYQERIFNAKEPSLASTISMLVGLFFLLWPMYILISTKEK